MERAVLSFCSLFFPSSKLVLQVLVREQILLTCGQHLGIMSLEGGFLILGQWVDFLLMFHTNYNINMMPVLARSRLSSRLISLTVLDQSLVEFHFWIFQLYIQLNPLNSFCGTNHTMSCSLSASPLWVNDRCILACRWVYFCSLRGIFCLVLLSSVF